MDKLRCCICLAVFVSGAITALAQAIESGPELKVVAFGSCNRQDKAQPLWNPILEAKPDLFIWTGDIVYGDTEDMALLKEKYRLQAEQADYMVFTRKVPVIGVYDDHDYGVNDGGKEYPQREASAQLLLDFLGESKESPRRKQEGVYASYDYGEADRLVRVIMLDTRYHREKPGPEADILGEAQWKWLESQLMGSPARVNLIVSSIQILPEQHRFEKWANFPKARERLFDLIAKSKARGVVMISGDRHIAEISRMDVPGVFYPIYEITSSGMTHSFSSFRGEPNNLRVGEPFTELHYGLIAFDWDAVIPTISMEIRDAANKAVRSLRFPLGEIGTGN